MYHNVEKIRNAGQQNATTFLLFIYFFFLGGLGVREGRDIILTWEA